MKIDLDPAIDVLFKFVSPPTEKVLVAAFCIGGAFLDAGYWQAFCGGE